MKQRTTNNLMGFLAGILLIVALALVMGDANATNYKKPQAEAEAKAIADASADAAADAAANAVSDATGGNAAADATASNDGNTLNVEGDRVENNSSNVVLVPNNNTESCVRVFGLAFGKNGESGAIGFPWRSAKCDYEQAADDAFAAGERDLGWFWKCQNKNLYKRFKEEGDTDNQAIEDCHIRMLSTTSKDEVVRKLEQRLEAAENLVELQRSHKEVCAESLERCQQEAYGSK